jgi:tetratricopeptide (TPR) repeat protein
MRTYPMWLRAAAFSALISMGSQARASDAPASAVHAQVKAAAAALNAQRDEEAYADIRQLIDDSSFEGLDDATRHTVLVLATETALSTGRVAQAHAYAVQATQSVKTDDADWRIRLAAAKLLGDVHDEAQSTLPLVAKSHWYDFPIPSQALAVLVQDTDPARFEDDRRQLLMLLYDKHWSSQDVRDESMVWQRLSLMLLESGDQKRAAKVAGLILDPDAILRMEVDLRYQPLLKALAFPDSQAAWRARRNHSFKDHPDESELERKERGVWTQIVGRHDRDAIDSTRYYGGNDAGVRDNDADNAVVNEILNRKAEAQWHLGEYDDAVATLEKAVALPDHLDKTSLLIVHANLLCALDKPELALQSLPADNQLSAYGLMQVALIRATAAFEQNDQAQLTGELRYLQDHHADSEATLQEAMLRVGASDEARQVLIRRLRDPILRNDALVQVQTYAEPPLPPRQQEWQRGLDDLKASAEVHEQVLKVGLVRDYSWRYMPWNRLHDDSNQLTVIPEDRWWAAPAGYTQRLPLTFPTGPRSTAVSHH